MIKFGVVMYTSVIHFECPKETTIKQVLDTIRIFDARYDHELTYDNKVLILSSTLYEMGIEENGIIHVMRINKGSFDYFAKCVYRDIPKLIQASNMKFQPLTISSVTNIDGLARNAILATQEALHDDECLRIAIRVGFATDKSRIALGLLEKHNFTKLSQEEMNYITETVERYFREIRYKIDIIIADIKKHEKPNEMPLPKITQRATQQTTQHVIQRNPQAPPKGPIILLPHLEPFGQFPFEVPTKSKNNK